MNIATLLPVLREKYALNNAEVMAEIELTFSAVLSRLYQVEVMAFFTDEFQLQAIAYEKRSGVIHQRQLDIRAVVGKTSMARHLQHSLAKAEVIRQAQRYKPQAGTLLWGEIADRDSERNIYIRTEIFGGDPVLAVCPANRVGVHERHSRLFQIGETRAFHLRLVEPVLLNGIPRLKIVVDRVSKTLVVTLLRSYLGNEQKRVNIHCVKRYVGHKSIVLVDRMLPRTVIKAVDRELRERVEVHIVNHPIAH
ncbi:MAG TPA: hypothetical protein DDY32_12640 [Desulfobulbaceae bacterium]|nr:hypothetical protein [Desulfobulbaceae bacterium]